MLQPHPRQSCRFLYTHREVLDEVIACAREREDDIVSQFLLASTFKKMNLDALPPHVPPPKPILQ